MQKRLFNLLFGQPRRLARIQLAFEERTLSRSQEFALAWRGADGARRELLRQQWLSALKGSCVEEEDFSLEIEGVKMLELTIDPDRGAGQARATLQAVASGVILGQPGCAANSAWASPHWS